jgi:hypothetical protein
MRSSSFCVVLSLVSIGACTPPEKPAESPIASLKGRAQNDLKCPAEEIHTKTVDDRTRVAWGCGHSGTYVESCEACGGDGTSTNVGFGVSAVHTESRRCNCTWMLNSPITAE